MVRSQDLPCSLETINTPGAVQSRGALLAIDRISGLIGQVSANLDQMLGMSAREALGQSLETVLGSTWTKQVTQVHEEDHQAVRYPVRLEHTAAPRPGLRTLNAMVHHLAAHQVGSHTRPVLVVEVEPTDYTSPMDVEQMQVRGRAWLETINEKVTPEELAETTARAIRDLTGPATNG